MPSATCARATACIHRFPGRRNPEMGRSQGKRIKTLRNPHRTEQPFNASDAMDAKDAQTPEGEIGPWRPCSGMGGLVFWKAAGENTISIAFQLKGFGVCVPLAPLALNGSEDVDALALGEQGTRFPSRSRTLFAQRTGLEPARGAETIDRRNRCLALIHRRAVQAGPMGVLPPPPGRSNMKSGTA